MAKRKKSSRKPKPQKKTQALPTTFDCLFCNHEGSVRVMLDKTKQGIGKLQCSTCRVDFATQINYLYKPVDVYYAWLDQVQSEESTRTKPTSKPRTSVAAPAVNEGPGPQRTQSAPEFDDDNEEIPPFEYPVEKPQEYQSEPEQEEEEDDEEDESRAKRQRFAGDTENGDEVYHREEEEEEAAQRHDDGEDSDQQQVKRRHSEIGLENEQHGSGRAKGTGQQKSGDARESATADEDRTSGGVVGVNDRGFFTESEEEPDAKIALPHDGENY